MKKLSVLFPIILLPLLITLVVLLTDTYQISTYMLTVSTVIITALFWVIYGFTNQIWISWIGVSIPSLLLVIINYYKLKINGAPFLPSDFTFFATADKILQFALPQIEITNYIFYIVLYLLATVILIIAEKYLVKNKKIQISALALGLTTTLLLFSPPTHNFIGKLGYHGTASSEDLILEHGIVAGLYSAVTSIPNTGDSALSKEKIYEIVNASKKDEQITIKPTVIFVMSESFFDTNRLQNVSFSEDPIKNFHTLQKQYSSGDFISSTYSGGTGNVEFEFLTGMCRYFLNPDDSFDNMSDETYRRIPSISDVFKTYGYSTKFVHSHDNSFFNRVNIYKNFNFDEVVFAENFKTEKEYSGGYISDKSFTNEIISMYESTTQKPLMLYAISMENHQPYVENKYDTTSGIQITSELLNDSDKNTLDTYLHGLTNADKALGQLIDYFSNVTEPVMIVFWGDHLPNLNLPENTNIYQKLNNISNANNYEWRGKDLLKMLTTDYVIWDNFNLEKKDQTIGSAMLGIEIMHRLGFEMPPYFNWLSESVKDNYLVYRSRVFASKDEVSDAVPTQYQNMINDYSMIVRDIVYGESTIFGVPNR